MRGADNRVAHEEVVGPDAHPLKTAEEVGKRVGGIVDAAQKHRLVGDGDAGIDEAGAGRGRLVRDLKRVVELRVDPDLARRAKTGGERVRHTHREGAWHARSDADCVDLRERCEDLDTLDDGVVVKQERIAARQKHLADGGMRHDIVTDAAYTVHVRGRMDG